MQWFLLAFSAVFLWSLTNISDQYLVARYSTGPRGSGGLVIFSSLIGLFVAIFIGIFIKGIFIIPLHDKLSLMLLGAITIAWTVLYLFALEIEDVSVVVPHFLTVPIFGYIFSYFLLNETMSLQQIIGSTIILLGIFLLSIDFSKIKRENNFTASIYMLVACILIAISGVIFKYITFGENFWVSSFWDYLGLGLSGVIIYIFVPKYRNEFLQMNQKGGKRIFALNFASETTVVIANLMNTYAILLAPVTMVYLIGSFQPAVVLAFTLIATKFFPKIVQENISKRILVPKIISIAIIILGSIILFI